MKKRLEAGYNERLFSKGFRKKLHLARFHWLQEQLIKYKCNSTSVIELGCFDAKTIKFFPEQPTKYLGLDANWEDGLEIAKHQWRGFDNFKFEFCSTPKEMNHITENFDIGICMETLEHIPDSYVDGYLTAMNERIRKYFFVTVPNETGFFFLMKYLGKAIFTENKNFTFKEIVYQTLGQTDKVKRVEHKGFNYRNMVDKISNHFEIIDISGHPLPLLPTSVNIGVGIVCRKKELFPIKG